MRIVQQGDRHVRAGRRASAAARRLPHGPVRADGPRRARRRLRGRAVVLRAVVRRAALAAVAARRAAVAAGRLGRKTGRGWYEYPPGPARVEASATQLDHDRSGGSSCQLVNEACFALGEGVGQRRGHRRRDGARAQPPARAARVGRRDRRWRRCSACSPGLHDEYRRGALPARRPALHCAPRAPRAAARAPSSGS